MLDLAFHLQVDFPIVQSARSDQSRWRPGGEFFARPTDPTQRRYETLRAYFIERLTPPR